ncbi:hypothetical protein P691DRAFT_667622 [Macrolepiota fuliginosa MF-IS2]|uniref:F-box domain-containing protein n=1 Tax=Macrolepiota fuliginosa MF-IS2 TaxID=1400762 RepID=A0A9P5XDD9_9AGAR|nr:hypothetical protein P691DRAFT_667622 [Macrolepiota fuliginosa MF-IS2]
MYCVLANPGLLCKIFQVLDNCCNLNNALVCRAWSKIALDILWRKVDDLYQLFTLLAPLEMTGCGDYVFSRPLEYNDWLRFQRCSRRVRELSYEDAESVPTFNPSVFDDISRSRITLSILPNLHSLRWSAAIPPCVLFMHSNVKHFTIRLPRAEPICLRPFFNDIAARMPALTSLDIRTYMPMKSFETEAVQLLSCLPRLKMLTMPRFLFTTRIAECVSRLPEICSIDFTYYEEQGIGDPEDVADFKPQLSKGAFASLSDLSLVATYKDVEYLLAGPFYPSNLTLLYVLSPDIENPTTLQQLIATVYESCTMLSTLTLISAPRAPDDSDPTTTDVSQRIKMEVLKPLFDCANLTSLSILHRHPLDLRQEDLDVLASRWSFLTYLTLNNELLDLHSSDLTLEALIPFARHCPNLIELGMFINVSPHLIPPFSPTFNLPSFKSLQNLCMGVSIITESVPVAMFLSQILPFGCEIDSGISDWGQSHEIQDEVQNVFNHRSKLWNEVDKLVSFLTKARMEEWERIKATK